MNPGCFCELAFGSLSIEASFSFLPRWLRANGGGEKGRLRGAFRTVLPVAFRLKVAQVEGLSSNKGITKIYTAPLEYVR